MNSLWEGLVTVAVALVGVAIIATLVSRNAQTPQVIQSLTSGFADALNSATSPVSGNTYSSHGFTGGSPLNQSYI